MHFVKIHFVKIHFVRIHLITIVQSLLILSTLFSKQCFLTVMKKNATENENSFLLNEAIASAKKKHQNKWTLFLSIFSPSKYVTQTECQITFGSNCIELCSLLPMRQFDLLVHRLMNSFSTGKMCLAKIKYKNLYKLQSLFVAKDINTTFCLIRFVQLI